MSEHDAFDERLRRLVTDATSDAPAPLSPEEMKMQPPPGTTTPDHMPSRRRWLAVATGGIAAALVAALMFVPRGDEETRPVDTGSATTGVAVVTSAGAAPSTGAPPTSAASTAPPATGATTTSTSTTSTSTPGTTTLAPELSGGAGRIDLSKAAVFGLAFGADVDVDVVITDIGPALGDLTFDTGWQPTPDGYDCIEPEFRTIWWGDFRLTFERSDTAEEVAAWTVGEPLFEGLAPLGEIPTDPTPSGVTIAGETGIGATRDEVAAEVPDESSIFDDDDRQVIVSAGSATIVEYDADGRMTSIGSSLLDCNVGPDL